jgi:SAM-dependent methyltransferase/tetratricopeptide (TPR) repeat protein
MQQDKKFYDEFYNKYPVYVHDNPERFNAVASLLSGHVLDVACGTATLSDYYFEDYIGIDISEVAIENAKKVRRKDITLKVADFANDAFLIGKKFDSIYIGEFLEHIKDDRIVFENVKDLIKPFGRVVVTVPNGERIPDESHCRTFTVASIRRDYSKYGKINFHAFADFKNRILFTIDFDASDENLISLVMTVKDEEKGIENAIISALPFVDSVTVSVDKSSTDNTALIAENYADHLVFHTWQNDFSKARNFAHKNVKSKYILFIDGHEFVKSCGDYLKFLKSDYDGILTTIEMENGTSFMYPRIYKNGLQFENSVHNALNCKNTVLCPNFVIVHDRLNAQTEKSVKAREIQRDKMIPKASFSILAKNPNDQRALFNLANWYMTKSDYKNAVKTYKKCLRVTLSNDEKYFVQAQLGIAHQMQDHQIRAFWYFRGLEKIQPNRWETKRLIAGIKIQSGDYRSALDFLVYSIDNNKQHYLYQLFNHDLAEIWDLIACCFFETNQYEKSVIAWQEAIKYTKNLHRQDFFKTKIQFCHLLLKSPTNRPAFNEDIV